MTESPLSGGCSCGRNQYTIRIPSEQSTSQTPRVFFDSSFLHRRSQATPLSAWLRVPLTWYESTTHAFFDDETHASIKKVYSSPEAEDKRQFCGMCGTPLSFWTESPASEAEFICVTLCSLTGTDLRDLEERGLLPTEALADAETDKEKIAGGNRVLRGEVTEFETVPWFETMVEGSRLGKMKTSKGTKTDGRFKIEWEIVEWTEGDREEHGKNEGETAETAVTGKRKLSDITVGR